MRDDLRGAPAKANRTTVTAPEGTVSASARRAIEG